MIKEQTEPEKEQFSLYCSITDTRLGGLIGPPVFAWYLGDKDGKPLPPLADGGKIAVTGGSFSLEAMSLDAAIDAMTDEVEKQTRSFGEHKPGMVGDGYSYLRLIKPGCTIIVWPGFKPPWHISEECKKVWKALAKDAYWEGDRRLLDKLHELYFRK